MMTEREAIIVVDLGYGDAGKGSVVDYLTRARDTHAVVRFNGGGQAAHTVVTPDGRRHTFAQFGSGSFVPGVATYLSRFMLVDPLALAREAEGLAAVGVPDALDRLAIDREALVVTPLHAALNRLRELARGAGRHGSCGLGIGETMAAAFACPAGAVRAGDLADSAAVRRKVARLRDRCLAAVGEIAPRLADMPAARRDLATLRDPAVGELCAGFFGDVAGRVALVDAAHLRRLLARPGAVVFEGAQGVLLDEWRGFHPYTTWSTTTFANAEALLADAGHVGATTRLGVLRVYATRHGPGPFVTEDAALAAALPEPHNPANPWQRAFRVGHLDLVAARYALAVAGPVDGLAVTHLDRLADLPAWRVCDAYRYDGPPTDLDGYFTHAGGLIRAIIPRRSPDLEHQARLTALLLRCRPVYRTVHRRDETTLRDDRGVVLARLEGWLGAPVALASSGPTATDKAEPARREAWSRAPCPSEHRPVAGVR